MVAEKGQRGEEEMQCSAVSSTVEGDVERR